MPTTAPNRRRRQTPRATFQEPLVAAPEEDQRPRDHNGIPVEREELIANLPNGQPFKISKLHLANGELAFACRDCRYTGDVRADVMSHRNELHGAKYGKRTPKVVFAKDKNVLDLVLPPRGDNPAPSNPMEMTLGEFLALVPSFAATADLLDRLERERDEALELARQHLIDKSTQHKIDVYDTLRTEVLDLRLQVQKVGNYEQIKQELYDLRAWKKKMITRLSSLGFVLSEEDE